MRPTQAQIDAVADAIKADDYAYLRQGHSYNDEEPGTGCVSYCPACYDDARKAAEQ